MGMVGSQSHVPNTEEGTDLAPGLQGHPPTCGPTSHQPPQRASELQKLWVLLSPEAVALLLISSPRWRRKTPLPVILHNSGMSRTADPLYS